MERVRLIAGLALLLPLCAAPWGCGPRHSEARTSLHQPPPRPALINHLAFFKLKDPADAPELIADCDRMLAVIPGVVSYHCGPHLDTGRGERVDGGYDVGFHVGFADQAAYEAYVAHPNHVEAVNKWRPRWVWIRVHDVIDPTP